MELAVLWCRVLAVVGDFRRARGFGTLAREPASEVAYMQHTTERPLEIADLRAFAERPVRVKLEDASEHIGTLRTELLSERSISVYLARDGQQGATIYIDEIVSIAPIA